MRFTASGLLLLLASFSLQANVILSEGFDNIATLPGSGWALVNNSAPLGTTEWFQGNTGVFDSQAGAEDAYIAANFNNAAFGGNISDWLITPMLTLLDGDQLSFYTRTEESSLFADSLEVRLSLNGASTNVGSTDSSVGDFTTLLLTINPTLNGSGYPQAWTQYTVTLSGLSGPATGRFAFRYDVPDTSVNADYIGIDTVTVNAVPEPATGGFVAFMIAAAFLSHRLRRGRKI